jgi:hypothetical protein
MRGREVVRVLKRFFTGGLDAFPRRTDPGRERRVTAAWEAERLAKEHLHLIYTPAYDPDANRHSHGTGLVLRRVVTHNHHRGTFELLQRVLDYVHRHIETKRNGEESPVFSHEGKPLSGGYHARTLP